MSRLGTAIHYAVSLCLIFTLYGMYVPSSVGDNKLFFAPRVCNNEK